MSLSQFYLEVVEESRDLPSFAGDLLGAMRLDVNNVAVYALDHIVKAEEGGMTMAEMVPCIAPLAPAVWASWDQGYGIGRTIKSFSDSLPYSEELVRAMGCLLIWQETDKNKEVRWVLIAQPVLMCASALIFSASASIVGVTGDGVPITHGTVIIRKDGSFEETSLSPGGSHRTEDTASLAICFAHCRGASLEERHLSRAERRRVALHREPGITFKTITITAADRVLREQGGLDKVGLQKALHICRGHFARYTDDAPLFGKPGMTGLYYHPMHLRGTAKKGVIEKNYRVLAPKED